MTSVPGRELHVVTGAFAFTGKYIARRLLADGKAVRTLMRDPAAAGRLPEGLSAAPYRFDDVAALTESLCGARVLYNTYWIRFPQGRDTFERAVENTRTLLRAAERAGVARVVQLSVTNASETSPFPYFRAKGVVERDVRASTLSHAIVRPTLVFGREDILLNNIAWLLRRLPVFLVPGTGQYRVQPVAVEDVADLAIDLGAREDNVAVDTGGPDTFTFEQLVREIAAVVGSRARLVRGPPRVAVALARAVGWALRDVLLTPDELESLMASSLVATGPAIGTRSLRDWLEAEATRLGRAYARPGDRRP